VISGWEGAYFDLRTSKHRRSTGTVADIVVPDEVATALWDLQLLDAHCERLVYQARAADDGVVLSADGDELDELSFPAVVRLMVRQLPMDEPRCSSGARRRMLTGCSTTSPGNSPSTTCRTSGCSRPPPASS
jgi:hypothetical protein